MMRHARSLFAAVLGALLAAAAGCGGSNQELSTYDNLQKGPEPAGSARSDPTGAATKADRSEAGPAAAPDEPALAEVPLIVTGIGPATTAGADEPAIAEGPEEITITAASPRRIELLIPSHKFRRSKQGSVWVTYDDIDLLKILNMDPVPTDAPDMMPDWLKGLDGKKVHVRGFMFPTTQATGLTHFILARDNQICCFGKDAKVYDLIGIAMRDGESTDYVNGAPIDVIGTFHILPAIDLDRLYRIDDAIVIAR